jgi:hypothetical protein
MCSPYEWKADLVAAETLIHGTIGGINASGLAAAPGAGVRPLGRVHCGSECAAPGVQAVAGETVRIDMGVFQWEQGSNTFTIADVAARTIAYAEDNQSVSSLSNDGEALGTVVHVDAQGVWVLSGYGVGTLEGLET